MRIAGRLTASGANVSLLTVTAPKGARIRVVCRGPGCPPTRVARTASTSHLPQFERALAAGTRLTVRVSKPGYVTRATIITIRRGRAPARVDGCLYAGRSTPSRCRARG